MHRCVYLTIHITKLHLQTTFPKPLYIYHISHVSIGTLAIENLDVCIAYDLWDSNIQLTMEKDPKWQIYLNIVQRLTLTLVDCHSKCHTNKKLTTPQNKWPICPKGTWWCETWTHICWDSPCNNLRFNDILTQSLDNQYPGAEHAFPRQRHMRRERVIYFYQGFLPCIIPSIDGWQDGWMDGWVMWKSFMKNNQNILYHIVFHFFFFFCLFLLDFLSFLFFVYGRYKFLFVNCQ